MKSNNIFALLTLFALAACGNDGGGSGSASNPPQREFQEATPGTYYSVLRPVNIHANGFIPYGAATFTLKDDQLQVSMSMDDDQSVNHRQTLHMGTRCPTSADDTNGDTFVDYNEAMAVVGEVLMPLDADLNSQTAGAEVYPKGPAMTYNKSASITNINTDLKQTSGTNIGFEGRVVIVHGTSSDSGLPASLASRAGEAAHVSLPVVCGILEKID